MGMFNIIMHILLQLSLTVQMCLLQTQLKLLYMNEMHFSPFLLMNRGQTSRIQICLVKEAYHEHNFWLQLGFSGSDSFLCPSCTINVNLHIALIIMFPVPDMDLVKGSC